jgi:hypothetical protein
MLALALVFVKRIGRNYGRTPARLSAIRLLCLGGWDAENQCQGN